MEEMMMTTTMIDTTLNNARFDRVPEKPIIDSTCPTWKLYENPFYKSQRQNLQKSIINKHLQYCHKISSSSSSDLKPFKRAMDSELKLDRNQVIELRAELEYERNLRKKVESLAKRLAKELDEEREGREAMERLCQELAREISSDKAEINMLKKEIEEERKMLRLAEILREERVQMKLAEVKLLFEDKLLELEDHMRSQNEGNEAGFGTLSNSIADSLGEKSSLGSDNSGIAIESSTEPTRSVGLADHRPSCDEAIELPSMAVQRRASPEPANPHILRGIKGFVEFPRVVRAMGSKSRDSDAKLECQKAQLRVLLKQKGIVRSNNNLIIS